jgi:hypothetical protein
MRQWHPRLLDCDFTVTSGNYPGLKVRFQQRSSPTNVGRPVGQSRNTRTWSYKALNRVPGSPYFRHRRRSGPLPTPVPVGQSTEMARRVTCSQPSRLIGPNLGSFSTMAPAAGTVCAAGCHQFSFTQSPRVALECAGTDKSGSEADEAAIDGCFAAATQVDVRTASYVLAANTVVVAESGFVGFTPARAASGQRERSAGLPELA